MDSIGGLRVYDNRTEYTIRLPGQQPTGFSLYIWRCSLRLTYTRRARKQNPVHQEEEELRFAVLGAGSLGLLVAGYLAKAGHEVVVIGKPEQAALLKERGLEVVAPSGFKTSVETASRPEEVGPADYLIVLVKARDTMAALDRVTGVEFGAVTSLQNGMAKNGQLIEKFGRAKVIGATSILGATLLEPGRTQHTMFGTTYFGELDGSRSERVDRLVAAFNQAGMKTEIPENILSAEWSKLCQIVPCSPPVVCESRLSTTRFAKVATWPSCSSPLPTNALPLPEPAAWRWATTRVSPFDRWQRLLSIKRWR